MIAYTTATGAANHKNKTAMIISSHKINQTNFQIKINIRITKLIARPKKLLSAYIGLNIDFSHKPNAKDFQVILTCPPNQIKRSLNPPVYHQIGQYKKSPIISIKINFKLDKNIFINFSLTIIIITNFKLNQKLNFLTKKTRINTLVLFL